MKAWQGKSGFQEMNRLGAEKTPFLAIISYDKDIIHIDEITSLSPDICKYRFPALTNSSHNSSPEAPFLEIKEFSKNSYKQSFEKVMSHINKGDTYLCNLSCEIPLKNQLDFESLFRQSRAKYKIRYKDEFICFSPESFIQIKQNEILTFPMKGTMDAKLPDAENQLLNDPKELAEHYTITDLLRNDLSRVSEFVNVKEFRYIDKIKTSNGDLLQTSSVIRGICPADWNKNIGSIFDKILPAGSITGAPKQRTCEIIKEAETHERGYYTGVCCLYDGESIDSFVMIRMIVRREGKFYYKSGGGITSFSQCDKEYNEVIQKVYVPVS